LNEALERMDALSAAMYAPADSIAPQTLLLALMPQVLYGVRSEPTLCVRRKAHTKPVGDHGAKAAPAASGGGNAAGFKR
jgi:hypothetical protein